MIECPRQTRDAAYTAHTGPVGSGLSQRISPVSLFPGKCVVETLISAFARLAAEVPVRRGEAVDGSLQIK